MGENKNWILAIILSVLIFAGFEYYWSLTRPPVVQPPQNTTNYAPEKPAQSKPESPALSAPLAPSVAANTQKGPATGIGKRTRLTDLQNSPRIMIETDRLIGSIALRGGELDDLSLADYRETLEPSSSRIVVFSPSGSNQGYLASHGWSVQSSQLTPGPNTLWSTKSNVLSTNSPVTLFWDNGMGLVFKRTYQIDENYMFTITQTVENLTSSSVTLYPYGLIKRQGTPETTGFYILHEGLLGVFNDQLTEVDYDDLQEKREIKELSTGGWIGITDKYWLSALIPNQNVEVKTRFIYGKDGIVDTYQTDYLGPSVKIAPGGIGETTSQLFAGAKEVRLLDQYAEKLNIKRFDLAIDFGWFYFLTKPIFLALLWLHDHVGNLGVAILILTVVIKLAFFPLANKSYESMSKMKKLQPEMLKLRERFSDDKMKLNQEMMALYKREKANPASGCLPILVQIPVFFALYKVLFVTIEMRHAPFFGWIQDLSAPDPTTIFNLFGLIPWSPPYFLMLGVWPLLMGLTMWLQQKLNPQPMDPTQAKIMMFLPIMFTFLLAQFPAGLVIYWAWNNSLSIAQQWVIMRRMGIKGKQALQ